jgi:hypothetical protein
LLINHAASVEVLPEEEAHHDFREKFVGIPANLLTDSYL